MVIITLKAQSGKPVSKVKHMMPVFHIVKMVLKKKELQHFNLFWYINFGECVSMPSHATPLLLLVKGLRQELSGLGWPCQTKPPAAPWR